MKQEITPQDTTRADAFGMWMSSPMPMVTLVKTMDVTRLVRYGRRHGMGFNMLLCWCIGKAAGRIPEFYTLPEHGRLFRYDSLAVKVVVDNVRGGISLCDIAMSDSLAQFNEDYLRTTGKARAECRNAFLDDRMAIGTSAMVQTELDCVVNQYTDRFSNPMVIWGRYRRGWLRTTLPVSFQFHHVQMDGGHAARFLETLQEVIDGI